MLDLVIKSGLVVDGSGKERFASDVGISNGIIKKVGYLGGVQSETVIDASGLIVSPGFIDTHTHSDFTIWVDPNADSSLRQGVTTQVIGNCGHSCAPVRNENRNLLEKVIFGYVPGYPLEWETFGEYLDALQKKTVSHNIVSLVGHGAIRIACMGFNTKSPSPRDLEDMKTLVDQAMSEGAFGLSTGLSYAPGSSAHTSEVIELCKVVSEHGGIYATHLRNYESGFKKATLEALEIGDTASVPVHLSHHRPSFGAGINGEETLKIITQARSKGKDVTCDYYPYTWGATTLTTLLPPWALDGGVHELIKRLSDNKEREMIREDIKEVASSHDTYILMNSPNHSWLMGKSIAEISQQMGLDPKDTILTLLQEEGENAYSVYFAMESTSQEILDTLMTSDFYMLGSDGITLSKYGELGNMGWHPRSYGAFPRMIAEYVRDKKMLTLEKAIMKMTLMAATRFRLLDRGLIATGMAADIVIFDENKIADMATYRVPNIYPKGISYVVVNGEIVVDGYEHTGARPGTVFRYKSKKT